MSHRRRARVLLALLLVVGTAAPAAAQPVTFTFHDGSSEGAFRELTRGDAEAAHFSPEHPCRLLRARLWFAGDGPADVWVWADNGGLQPDFERPFAGPIRVAAHDGQMAEVDLGGVRVDPPQAFFVGIVHDGPTPALLVDADGPHAQEYRSLLYVWFDELGKKIWTGVQGTFLVEADVEYVDVLTERWFTDVTEAAGVVRGGRVAWPDYDGDGDLDLAFDGARLYRNDGAGAFTDVSAAAGLAGAPTNGGVWADYDNDGDLDLYATVHSFQSEDPTRHDRLFRNEGDGTFTDVSDAAGAPYDDLPTEAAAWGDYDGDGFVDLYVANYEQPGDVLAIGTPDFLWHNEGDGTFRDASEAAGIRTVWPQCGRGVAWADFDQDGDLDVYVSNYRLDPNFLWVNQGDGTFLEEAALRGVQGIPDGGGLVKAYGHTIGSVWGDLDLDGDLDLVAANLAHPRFIEFSDKTMVYRARSGPLGLGFEDVRAAAGVAYAETHSNPSLGDVDNDGDLDLYLTSVYEGRASFLYRNEWVPAAGEEAGLRFTDVSYPSGAVVMNGWGSTFADFDGDGDLDLVAGALLRNDRATAGGHWLAVHLEGTASNRAAIGARVAVAAGGRVFVRQVEGGSGTGCQPPLTQHVGLGATATVDRVVVRWPGGRRETFEGPFAADQRLALVEGSTAGPPPPDAGATDTAAAPDAGGPPADAGAGPDTVAGPDTAAGADVSARTDTSSGGGGGGAAGCAAAPASTGAPLALAALLLLLLALRRCRRPVARAPARAESGRCAWYPARQTAPGGGGRWPGRRVEARNRGARRGRISAPSRRSRSPRSSTAS